MTTTKPVPVFASGDRVTYLGHAVTVIHGNEPDEWSGQQPEFVNIRLDRPACGHSRQFDIQATTLAAVIEREG